MYTAILRMAYLGDGISSDYGDPTEEEKLTEEGELEDVPPIVVPPDEPEEEEV